MSVSLNAFFATCPLGLEQLLCNELHDLGAQQLRETAAGVSFSGDDALMQRVCLMSRLSSRLLLVTARAEITDAAELYEAAAAVAWEHEA